MNSITYRKVKGKFVVCKQGIYFSLTKKQLPRLLYVLFCILISSCWVGDRHNNIVTVAELSRYKDTCINNEGILQYEFAHLLKGNVSYSRIKTVYCRDNAIFYFKPSYD